MVDNDEPRGDGQAVPLAEAAERLGLSRDALRMRIRRGKARGFKRDGHVFVWLDGMTAGPPPAAAKSKPAAAPAAAGEAEPWPALVALQREEISRLLQETERLNARLERHLDEAREMRQMLQREQVLRQQEQALRRDTQDLLNRLVSHPALAAALGTAVLPQATPSPAAPPQAEPPPATETPQATRETQELAAMLKEIGQSLRDLEAKATDESAERRWSKPTPPERD